MKLNEAKQEIKGRWREICENRYGLAKTRVSGKDTYICPFCGHGSNGDGLKDNPKSKDGTGIKCFGACQFSGDIIDLTMKEKGVDFVDALKICCDDLHIILDDPEPRQERKQDRRQSLPEFVPDPVYDGRYDYTEFHILSSPVSPWYALAWRELIDTPSAQFLWCSEYNVIRAGYTVMGERIEDPSKRRAHKKRGGRPLWPPPLNTILPHMNVLLCVESQLGDVRMYP